MHIQSRRKKRVKPKRFSIGVLMVMMENYEGKKLKFLPTGKLAVGIKYTRDGIGMAEN